jgi:ABC-type oligopeptide transport system substrate-binding subunit
VRSFRTIVRASAGALLLVAALALAGCGNSGVTGPSASGLPVMYEFYTDW